jgi:ribosomal protein S12 methylthiotransferase
VPADVVVERARVVQETEDRRAWERQRKLVGTVREVLVDGPSENAGFRWDGRTAAQAPEIDGVVSLRDPDLRAGQRLPVRIVEADGYDLVGVAAAQG